MAIFLLASKEMVARVKKLSIWMVPLHFKFHWLVLPMLLFQWEFNESNNILVFSCRLIRCYFIIVYREVCVSKTTKVAYAFLVQYFENTTIVAYAGLRVKPFYCIFL